MIRKIKGILKKEYYKHLYFHLNVEVSAQCNFNCRICGFQEFYKPKGLMSMDTFRKLEDTFERTNSVLFGFNAETLLNPDVIEMLKFAKKANPNMHVSILTNGSLLTKELSEQLITNGLNDLSISIDAATNETYKKLRNYDLDKIKQNIRTLDELKEKHKSRTPSLGTNFVATKENIHELLAFIDLAKELKLNYIRLTNVEPYTQGIQDTTLYGDNYTTEVGETIKKAEEKCKKLGIIFSYPKFKKDASAVCEFMQPIVDWQGNVIPCSQFSYDRDTLYYGKKVNHPLIILGNINKKSFEKIWNSRKYKQFRKDVVKGRGPELCYKYCLLREKVLCPK